MRWARLHVRYMAIFGTLDVVRSQTQGWAGFDTAFAYLQDLLQPGSAANTRIQSMAAGEVEKIELADGVFAMEQVYLSKPRYARYESHRRYTDIQVIITGEELMEVADVSRLAVEEPYVEERDVIVYGDYAGASVLRFQAGDAAVYRPEDGHMPNLRVGAQGSLVRKVVVKIPV